MIEPASTIKIASTIAMGSTAYLATVTPDPRIFEGWGIHLVLGAVAIACLWVVYKMSERQLESVKQQSEALLKMTAAIDAQTASISALSVELKRSPCLLHRIQAQREDLSPEVRAMFDHERGAR